MTKTPDGRQRLPANLWGYLAGKLSSSCAMWSSSIASALAMYAMTRSAFMVGMVSAGQFSGPLFTALWAGALSDRFARRRIIMLGRGLAGLASIGLFVGSRLGSEIGVTPAWLIAGNVVMGLGLGISSPAMHAIIPSLVERGQLPTAIAWSSSTGNIGRAIGPAIGAALTVLSDPYVVFAVAAALHAVFVGILLIVRPMHQQDLSSKARLDILAGWAFIRANPVAGRALLFAALVMLAIDSALTLAPPLAASRNLSEAWAGGFTSGFGFGALAAVAIASPSVARWGVNGTCLRGMVLVALGLGGAGLVHTGAGAVMGFFIAGFGFLMSVSMLNSRIQLEAPDVLRGRIMAFWSMAFIGTRPIASTVNGAVADLSTPSFAATMNAVLIGIGAVVYWRGMRSVDDA